MILTFLILIRLQVLEFFKSRFISGDLALKFLGNSFIFVLKNRAFVTIYAIKRADRFTFYAKFHQNPDQASIPRLKNVRRLLTINIVNFFRDFKDRKSLELHPEVNKRFNVIFRTCLAALLKHMNKDTRFFTTVKLRKVSSVTTFRFIVFVADTVLMFFRIELFFGPASLKLKNFLLEVFRGNHHLLPSQALALLLATVFVTSIKSGGFLGLFCKDNKLPLSTLYLPKAHGKLYFRAWSF